MFTSSINLEGLQALLKGKDPVCGMEVEASRAAGASTYAGHTYYFCAPACKKTFDENPEKYTAA